VLCRHIVHHTQLPSPLASKLRLLCTTCYKLGNDRRRNSQPGNPPSPSPNRPRLRSVLNHRPSNEHHRANILPRPRTRLSADITKSRQRTNHSGKTSNALQTPRRSFHVPIPPHSVGNQRPRFADSVVLRATSPPDRLQPKPRYNLINQTDQST
jgi:hypothetical protein